jgi:ribonucleoside-diphosphate reductase alpha chain
MNVVKVDGESEPLDIEKIHKVVGRAVDGLNGVSLSEVEMNANLSFYDGITTAEIQQVLIKSANDLISEQSPNYQIVAAQIVEWLAKKARVGR